MENPASNNSVPEVKIFSIASEPLSLFIGIELSSLNAQPIIGHDNKTSLRTVAVGIKLSYKTKVSMKP